MAFRIRGRVVDPSLNRVTSEGRTVQVEPKIMQVLLALVERPGEVLTRDELMARVWPGVFVTDDVLHRAVRELRRLFDAPGDEPGIIETIRKRGYRLVTPVEPPDTTDRPAIARKELAVSAWMASVLAAAIVGGVALALFGMRQRASVGTEERMRFTPYTSDPGNEVTPALSSSGRLAYVARGGDGRPHVFVKRAPEERAVQVTNGADRDYAPTWSPDESRIAFVRKSDHRCAIRITTLDGSSAYDLMPCTTTDEFRMSWSPDGASLAITTGAATLASPSHIDVVDIATARKHAITSPPAAYVGDTSPAFSPDGSRVAFVRCISGALGDIFVVPATGGTASPVTADPADILGLDWEPDGGHLVFSSDRGGAISLWRVAISGGEPTVLAGGGAKLKHPSVARRSGAVAYEEWQYEINLVEGDVHGNRGSEEGRDAGWVPISPTSDRWNFHPQVSPDGRRLAFQSTRSGEYEIWIASRDGHDARQITRSIVYKSLPRWAPDSRRVVFATRSAANTALIVVDTDASIARTIMTDSTAAIAPSWSHDGRRVYFGSHRTGSWEIWSVDVANGESRQETTDGGYAALESIDGRWLYYTQLDRPGLFRRQTSGSHATEVVVARLHPEEWPNWGVLDRGVFYLAERDDGDPQLAIANEPLGSAPRLLTRLPEFAWAGVAVSRDGSRVIYAHADRREANIGGLILSR